jgi:hypothetical protein
MPTLDEAIAKARTVLDGNDITVRRLCFGDGLEAMKADQADVDEHFILGVAMEPTDGTDGEPIKPDVDNEVYSPEDVVKACYWYAEHGRKKGYLHGKRFGGFIMEPDDTRVVLLMSWITPVEIAAKTYGDRQTDKIKKGTWLVAFRVNDAAIWEEIKTGKINGLSIGAYARRRVLENAA